MRAEAKDRILVFAATYNERDCVEELVNGLYENLPCADYLFIDDNSPDGTFECLEKLRDRYSNLILVKRPKKLGLGSAHRQAFKYACEQGYEFFISMDADLSHDPKELPRILELLQKHDYVIGSRFLPSSVLDYTGLRKALSINANRLARSFLSLNLSEATTSFRGFKRELLKNLISAPISSDGYGFFVETAFFAENNAKSPVDFPIHFYDRRNGKSKLSKFLILRAALCLLTLSLKRLFTSR